jgi:transposase
MEFKEFIGIDVSKNHIDVSIYSSKKYTRFDNKETGFKKMIKWIDKDHSYSSAEALFAFEHTGLYSLPLSLFLNENQYKFTVIPGLELKRSRGIARGKADDIDARAIAEYAYEKKERIKLHDMPGKVLLKLKRLLSYRERLVKERAAFKGRFKEFKAFLNEEDNEVLFDSHSRMLENLNEEIKVSDDELNRLLKEDEKLLEQYELITSIKGLGSQTALMLIVLTNGFTQFNSWRKFASYSGTAPFPNQSGMFKGRTSTSHLANKRIKSLLSCCATSAKQHNPEMRLYYQRRVAEGKNEMSTLNIIRNKLIARAFAVVQRGTPYVDTLKFAA